MDDGLWCYFDVDETLISYFMPKNWVSETNHSKYKPLVLSYNTIDRYVYPLTKNIELIDELKVSGHKIAAWSRSGSNHTERIIQLLNLENKIDLIVPKPTLIVDDKPFEDQSIPRVYKL